MAELSGGQSFIQVLPSMKGYFQKVASAVKGNKVTQQIDVDYDKRKLDKAKSDLEKLTKSTESMRRKEADAAGAVTVAEKQLQALRDKGVTDAGRIAAAEEKVEKARRASTAASQALQDAESKRGAGERRVTRLEARFDGSKAEGEAEGFFARLSRHADEAGPSIGSRLVSGLGGVLKKGLIATGLAAGTFLAGAITKGAQRLIGIDDARGKLQGLGHDAAGVETIMDSALASVKGTAFGLADAATIAASAVAAGIKPGEELTDYLKLTGDTASIAGTSLEDMGAIFNKVQTSGKAYTLELKQLSNKGIPIFQWLQEEYKVSAEELSKMVSDGKVDSATFQKVIKDNIGGAALESGKTVRGAFANMGAATGRFGAILIGPFFNQATDVFGGITGLIDKAAGAIEPWAKKMGDGLNLVKGILVEGDFKGEFAKAFDLEEDAPIVGKLFRVREALQQTRDTVQLFVESFTGAGADVDLPWMNKVIDAGSVARDWFDQLARIFTTLKDTIFELGPPLATIAGSLGEATAAIGVSVWSVFLDLLESLATILQITLVPAVQLLANLMRDHQPVVTFLVGAYTAYRGVLIATKAAQLALNLYVGIANGLFLGQKVAVAGSTAATKANTIAVGLNKAGSKAWGVITAVSSGIAKGAAVSFRALSAAIKANPMMAIVSAITLVVGALVWFFTKTELGKNIWDKVWNGIKAGLAAAWDFMQPIFAWIGGLFTWLWKTIISPIFTVLKVAVAVVATAFVLWWEVVKLYFTLMGAIFTWLWETIAQPVWNAMKVALQAVGDFFGWVWSALIKPAWDALGAGISFVWNSIIKPTWDLLKTALDAVGKFFGWVWSSIIKPAWDALGAGISWVWTSVISPVWEALKSALGAVGDFFTSVWNNVIKPAWDGLGAGIKAVWENVIRPAWDALKEALGKVRDFFTTVVDGIKDTWNKLKGYLAKPVNFMITRVWNDGIREAWNTVTDFIPGLAKAGKLDTIPEHATGGPIRGPGTGTSDDVLMWGSNGEHMVTTNEVQKAGGHNAVYAIRDMIARRIPFSWDNGRIIRDLGRKNVDRYGAAARKGDADPQGLFGLLPKYNGGGEIAGAPWQKALEVGHAFAKSLHGNPYTWGFEDCSGYMSKIADKILGGPGVWSWATGSFPGNQPWAPGLGEGFSVGVHDNPGGAGGGHTAGTLTGVGPYATVNVESGGGTGGGPTYGGPAVGADSPQFAGKSPGLFHLAIGADGSFESAGGPSPDQKISFLQQKIADILDLALNPIKDTIAGVIGTAPPAWLDVPPKYMDTGRDKAAGFLAEKAALLGDALSAAWDTAKNIGSTVGDVASNVGHALTFGLLRDQGGYIPNGLSIVRNETGRPEAVLNWDQAELIRDILRRIGFGGLEDPTDFDQPVADIDWHGVGTQIGSSLLAEWGNDLLGMGGFSSQFEGMKLVDEHGRFQERSDAVGERTEATIDEGPTTADVDTAPSSDNITLIETIPQPEPEPAKPSSGGTVVDEVKRAFRTHGWDSGNQWAATDYVVGKESSWQPTAQNPNSSAFGLFQFLDQTWASVGATKTSDPYLQGVAGAKYMAQRYGDPVSAKSFWEKNNWYDQGGLARGKGFMLKNVIHPERVLDPRETRAFEQLVPMLGDLDRIQQNVTAPGEAVTASDRRAMEYAPAGGDTWNVYGKPDSSTLQEVGIFKRQTGRNHLSRGR